MSLSDFELREKLGEGAYSTVYKAHRKSDGKPYALKQVKFGALKEKEKENALTEIRILASVHHPNVAGYKQAFIDKASNTLCIVMELADGGDLLQAINTHKKNRTHFKEQDLWDYFIQATRGLKALHDLKVLHRDLKCANIFLCHDGTVKLGDMNVSKVAKRGLVYTQTGTPYYASPEVWRDQPYNLKSDIWSLGCVFYEAAALEPPFRASDMKGLFRKVVKGEYPSLPRTYSSEFSELISLLLKINPAHRPSCDEILNLSFVKNRCKRGLTSPNENSLLGTIHIPRHLNALTEILPAPNYNRPKLEDLSKDSINQRTMSEKNVFKPRVHNFTLRKAYEGVRSRGFSQDTVAARIKALKEQINRPSRIPSYNRPVVKPTWWG